MRILQLAKHTKEPIRKDKAKIEKKGNPRKKFRGRKHDELIEQERSSQGKQNKQKPLRR